MNHHPTATVVFVITQNNILLATKMKKVGAGKWNGYGGKPEPQDNSLRDTACRELFEESGKGIIVQPENLVPRCIINFYSFDNHSEKPDWTVAFYLAFDFTGIASSTEEMSSPTWFSLDQVPYENMLPADQEFIPKILDIQGMGTFYGTVRFSKDMQSIVVSEYNLAPLEI